jgi:hypothetical protein
MKSRDEISGMVWFGLFGLNTLGPNEIVRDRKKRRTP